MHIHMYVHTLIYAWEQFDFDLLPHTRSGPNDTIIYKATFADTSKPVKLVLVESDSQTATPPWPAFC